VDTLYVKKDRRIRGYYSKPKVFRKQLFGKHCIRMMSTRISQSVYKCSFPTYTTTDPEREEHVALFYGPSITNEFCAVLCTLNSLATRFTAVTKYTVEQRVCPV
jgi:hypothetical protein